MKRRVLDKELIKAVRKKVKELQALTCWDEFEKEIMKYDKWLVDTIMKQLKFARSTTKFDFMYLTERDLNDRRYLENRLVRFERSCEFLFSFHHKYYII